jgi:predicted permease
VKPTATERLVRTLLWCYPPSFRRQHGDEILQFVRTAARDGASPAALASDLLRGAPGEWATLVRADSPRGEPMRNILRDFRHASRLLAKSPGFTIASVLTLALGIGANTAMFTLADATLLRPVQVRNPHELVVWSWSSSYPDFAEYAKRTDIFQGVVGFSSASRVNLAVDGVADLTPAAFVTGNAFEVLGVRVVHGRAILPSDDVTNGPIVAVLSHDYWRSKFGSDPSVVGRSVRINGRPATIIGVVERGFRGTTLFSNPSFYVPTGTFSQVRTGFMSRINALSARSLSWLTVIGRLQPGISPEQAASAMDALYARLHGPPPAARTREVLRLDPLPTKALGSSASKVRTFVVLLVGVVGMTLLIGCANLANLLLARSATRRREMGVRLGLGATRRRVLQQMLAESGLLAGIGGAAGLAVAALALRLLATYELPGGLNLRNVGLELDTTALLVTFALSLATGVLFGLAPAWRAARTDVMTSLRDHGRSTTARGGVRSALLATQLALSLILLTGTVLFGRSLSAALKTPLGLDARGVVTASVNAGLARFDKGRAKNFYLAGLERVQALPQVESAAWANLIPTRGAMVGTAEIEGYAPAPGEDLTVYSSYIGPDYFRTVRTQVLSGRAFEPTDTASAPIVAVINDAMAKKYWAGRNPIGGRFTQYGVQMTVVGVVENTVQEELRAPTEPLTYLAFNQWLEGRESIGTDAAHLFVRARDGIDPEALPPLVRDQLRSIEAEVPLYDLGLFDERLRTLVMPQRMGLALFGLFSVLALTLATVGIYGVASYVASQRTREIGVRIALGATGASVRRLILREGATPIALGIGAGLALALYASRFAEAFLYDVQRFDVLTFVSVPLLLAGIALLATYVPARRAARIAPVDALRNE